MSLNPKFKSMNQMIADRKLQKELGDIEQEFSRDAHKRRKETLAIRQEYFKLQKEKGTLNANSLLTLESSPGIQERNTRSKRFGGFDAAMLKAKDDEDDEEVVDNRTFSEKRLDSLIRNQLSTVATVETSDKPIDPYKRSLDRILDNSKTAKDARITALKVKALEGMKRRGSMGNPHLESNRRDSSASTMSFTEVVARQSRTLSVPNASFMRPMHARSSLSDSNLSLNSASSQQSSGRARTRKRSNSLAPPTMSLQAHHHWNRRRSDTPLSMGSLNLEEVKEVKPRSSSFNKFPDIHRG